MKVFRGFAEIASLCDPVVTVGSYDGVHLGHRKILEKVVSIARESGRESLVVTFYPHPRQVLGDGCGVELLTTLEEKQVLLAGLGIDNMLVVDFTPGFSTVSSYDFVKDYIIGAIRAGSLVVGYDHHFGHNKEGNYDYLDKLRREFTLEIYMMPRQDIEGEKISSTAIRNFISAGELSKAEHYLGYPYFIIGTADKDAVTPTDRCKLLPCAGSYKAVIGAGEKTFRGGILIDGEGHISADCGKILADGEKIVITFC